jgi:hypothetical protein
VLETLSRRGGPGARALGPLDGARETVGARRLVDVVGFKRRGAPVVLAVRGGLVTVRAELVRIGPVLVLV